MQHRVSTVIGLNASFFFIPTVNAWLFLTSLKACDWSGHVFGASASPRFLTKKLAMSPPSTVHGGRHDIKYVTFVLLLHAAFVLTKFGVVCLNHPVHYFKFATRVTHNTAESHVPGIVLLPLLPQQRTTVPLVMWVSPQR